MTSFALDTFAAAGSLADAARPKVQVARGLRRRSGEVAVLGFVLTVAVLHLSSAILHPSVASREPQVSIVGP